MDNKLENAVTSPQKNHILAQREHLKYDIKKTVKLPPSLSVACDGKTADNVLRRALKVFIWSVTLTDLVGSLEVWGLRPHIPPLTLSVAWAA